MPVPNINLNRLCNQQVVNPYLRKAGELIEWMGAIQAQEYAMAKWSIGLRLKVSSDNDIEKAFNKGEILRTHFLRPTWHFVAPKDIRWMLQLTAPHVSAINAFMYRKCGLDKTIFKRCNDIITKSLEGGKCLTRDTLKGVLEKEKISGDGVTMSCIMMQAELEGLICSGPRDGKQFTYALLEERVPKANVPDRDEALAELVKRYFTSRSPATLKDFTYWSGLPLKDAKRGTDILGTFLEKKVIEGVEYFVAPATKRKITGKEQTTFLMSDYDEYGMSYKDKSAIFNPKNVIPKGKDAIAYNRMVIHEGIIAGAWKRTIQKDKVVIEIVPFTKLDKTARQSIGSASEKFAIFLGLKHEVIIHK